MKATRNFYHINIDDTENWEITTPNGTKLFFDPEFDTVNNIIQYGKIINPPVAITKHPNMLIAEAGDTVYFHHQVFDNRVEFEEDYFRWATQDQLYFILKKDNVVMMNNFVLIEPIEFQEKTASGILLEANSHKIEQRGILKALPDHADELGLEIGDEVVFTKNCDYLLKLQENEFYLMDVGDIIGVVVWFQGKETIVPIDDWTIIEPLDEGSDYEDVNGVMIQRKILKEEKHRGLVHSTLDKFTDLKTEIK